MTSAIDAMPVTVDLSGKTCLVTGAAGGIGSAVSATFLKAGANVLATDLHSSQQMQNLVELSGGQLQFFEHDLCKDADLESCIERTGYEGANVLFNNAGIFDMAPLLESTLEQYDRIFALNVRAMFRLMQGMAGHLVASGISGSIINLSSGAGRHGHALTSHYCASKAAVISYTQSAALAFAKNDIKVNAIAPGEIDTPMWQLVERLFAKYENQVIGEKRRLVSETVPMGRMGVPADIAGVAVFLASDLSRYVTGQTINVDGGDVLS